jgi:hypothetical protein
MFWMTTERFEKASHQRVCTLSFNISSGVTWVIFPIRDGLPQDRQNGQSSYVHLREAKKDHAGTHIATFRFTALRPKEMEK